MSRRFTPIAPHRVTCEGAAAYRLAPFLAYDGKLIGDGMGTHR